MRQSQVLHGSNSAPLLGLDQPIPPQCSNQSSQPPNPIATGLLASALQALPSGQAMGAACAQPSQQALREPAYPSPQVTCEANWDSYASIYSRSPSMSAAAGLLRPHRSASTPTLACQLAGATMVGLTDFQQAAVTAAMARSKAEQVAVFDWDYTSFCGDAAMMSVYHLLITQQLRLTDADMERFFPAGFWEPKSKQFLRQVGPKQVDLTLLRQDIFRLHNACTTTSGAASEGYQRQFLIKACHFVTAINQDKQLSLRDKGYHWLGMLKGWREQELKAMIPQAYKTMSCMAGKAIYCAQDAAAKTSYISFQFPNLAPQQEIRQLMRYFLANQRQVVVVTANYQSLVEALMAHLDYPKVKVLGVMAALDHDDNGRILGHPVDILPLVWGQGKAKILQREQLSPWFVAGDSPGDIAMMKLPDVQLRLVVQHSPQGGNAMLQQLGADDGTTLDQQALLAQHRLLLQAVCPKKGIFLPPPA